MPELPSGTVTFLFSDIEGSTNLLRDLGDSYADALAGHRDVFRSAFAEHGGVEVDTQGDAFLSAFARASDAVAAAAEIQSRLAPGPIHVRIGVHTGEPQLTDEGYVGLDVHRGARVCAAGHGGQVLLSQTTRDLVEVGVTDLGEHRLKDLLEPQRLFQLGTDEFPPLKTLNWTNLPVQATPLIGRERELAEAGALLREQRLLTVVGPPGSGKTRLALQLAADAADEFENVWWVGLQEIHDAELVEPTIAQTVGAKADLAGYLRDRRALLLLDNVEQVLDCAPRLAELLAGASHLKLLTTSREPLRLTLEQQYPVPPLPEDDAVSLFGERARAVRPGFDANGEVNEICRRLDGLPLAIELAAARVKLLAPDILLERLEQRLALLTGGARDLPERQQTLRATIEWSYELLDPPEQELIARLSVFAGGWSLEAAEAVCEAGLETLASLVDKSLVREREGRFSMLETIREYASERLAEQDSAEATRRRHVAYFTESAEQLSGEPIYDLKRESADWFVSEHDNLRTALDWLHEQPEPEQELRLAAACHKFWYQFGLWTEGRQRLEAALTRADEVDDELRAGAMLLVAQFLWHQGDYERSKMLAEETIALDEKLGVTGPRRAHAEITLAICEEKLGNGERSGEIYEAALSRARAGGDDVSVATILNNIGNNALATGDLVSARTHIEESVEMNRRLGQEISRANNLIDLGFIALAESRLEAAATVLRESLAIIRVERVANSLVWVVEALAALALARGDAVSAARLLAATTRPREELGIASDFYTIGEKTRGRTLEGAREQLGDGAFAVAWEEGEQLSLEDAGEAASRI
jgi:predicted ATPase